MKCNVGTYDRLIRIILGLFIAIVGGIFLYKWNHFKCL